MNESRIFSNALATATDDELVKAAAALPTELALGLLAITRALRPRTGTERRAYDARLRRALTKDRPHQTMLRTILKEAMR
jgi:hypothetical protein